MARSGESLTWAVPHITRSDQPASCGGDAAYGVPETEIVTVIAIDPKTLRKQRESPSFHNSRGAPATNRATPPFFIGGKNPKAPKLKLAVTAGIGSDHVDRFPRPQLMSSSAALQAW